jgi:hypothetical protein
MKAFVNKSLIKLSGGSSLRLRLLQENGGISLSPLQCLEYAKSKNLGNPFPTSIS